MALRRAVLLALVAVTVLFLIQASVTEVSASEDPSVDQDHGQPAAATAATVLLRRFLANHHGHQKKKKKQSHHNGHGNHHGGKGKKPITCDKRPDVCYKPGSPGPDCCKKKCVNLRKDRQNCGRCGQKCFFNQQCCSGRCVNVLWNPNNCGRCYRRCPPGVQCKHGRCGYA